MVVHAAEPLTSRVVDSLYTEAMLLADEARAYFEDSARDDRVALDPLTRVSFSCESLKVTTRLMHIVAWLLSQRAAQAQDLAQGSRRKMGKASDTDLALLARFPENARALISASCDLYARVKRIDEGGAEAGPSPARALMSRLERSI